MILTAEADSLSTDAKQLLEDYGLVGCHSNNGNYLSVHARIDSTGSVRILWESNDEEDKGSHAAIFEVKFGKKRRKDHSPIRVSGQLRRSSVIWSLLQWSFEGSDSKDNFVLTANCIRDTREKAIGNQIRSSKDALLCMSPPS